MNNKIEITKVLKNLDEYTEEELKAGRLYQTGFEYNGKIYYFEKPVICYSDMPGLFKYFMVENGNEADSYTTYMYEQYRKVFTKISAEYKSNWLFNKVLADEVIYTKKEEKDVIKDIKNKSVNNSNNVKKQVTQQIKIQNNVKKQESKQISTQNNAKSEVDEDKKEVLDKLQEILIFALIGGLTSFITADTGIEGSPIETTLWGLTLLPFFGLGSTSLGSSEGGVIVDEDSFGNIIIKPNDGSSIVVDKDKIEQRAEYIYSKLNKNYNNLKSSIITDSKETANGILNILQSSSKEELLVKIKALDMVLKEQQEKLLDNDKGFQRTI